MFRAAMNGIRVASAKNVYISFSIHVHDMLLFQFLLCKHGSGQILGFV